MKFKKRKEKGETNVQMSKKKEKKEEGGAGRALFERNTGSWHPRGRELSYGTEARVWGTGKILIYKIDVWQILISMLMPQSHVDICSDSASSTENSQLIK